MFPEPLSPYAVSKLAQEYYGRVFNYLYGLKITSLRFFNIYGPKQNPSSNYSGVISIFLAEMLSGKRPVIYGDGNNTRDFVYVDDAVNSIIKACFIERETSEVINIGTGKSTSLNSLVKTINNIIGADLQPKYLPFRQGDILHSLADISKGKSLLTYMPKYTIEEGMTKLIAYLADNKVP
ncbi:MAG: NAD-dependent epimerase/dehydratase family protein [Peptococcaceae bacterium]|nr:NAD-dependent epimerase/dehydratase family protein [Peptococcaceae bacterium]